ncbi:MAG TPA: alpha-mannosidase [Halomicronema sp.]
MVFSNFSEIIDCLRRLSVVDVRAGWRFYRGELNIAEVESVFFDWPVVCLNEKGHVAWEENRQVFWLAQKITVPPDLFNYPLQNLCLRLRLVWWAEDVQVYVNGVLVQEGDLFDSSIRLVLSSSVTPGDQFLIALRLVSPGHDKGALVSSICIYESSNPNLIDPGFVADELSSIYGEYLGHELNCSPENTLRDEAKSVKVELLTVLTELIDWENVSDRDIFNASLSLFRRRFFDSLSLGDKDEKEGNSEINLGLSVAKKQKISLVGHAHLDLAWLWPVSETWIAAQRTFESVLSLQKDFPDLVFCHSTPALYEWVEKNRPDLFSQIQEKVKAGVWEVVGGMWVEPDLNLIGAESLVRQVLYGQRYCLEKFNRLMSVCWVPDTFGFCASLPQVLKQGGVEYFVTQKLRWNDTTKFPYGIFWWESADGTQILSYMSALIGESIEPVKMVQYAREWESQTGLKNSLWLPGVGDHGGGPSRDMLQLAGRWKLSPFFPDLEFTQVETFLSKIFGTFSEIEKTSISTSAELEISQNLPETEASQTAKITSNSQTFTGGVSVPLPTPKNIPVWKDELYLEFHRGCYTTHAEQKLKNRQSENLLYQAELFSSLATIVTGKTYPKTDIELSWKKTLFNQFHDILPGSSIPEVYIDANQEWEEVEQTGTTLLYSALNSISSQIRLPQPPHPNSQPIVIFNSLNWKRTEVVELPLSDTQGYFQISDFSGNPLTCQVSPDSKILFLAKDIPAIGYALFWLSHSHESQEPSFFWAHLFHYETSINKSSKNVKENWEIENKFLRIKINHETGNLRSVYDKINDREIVGDAEINQLQAFEDKGQYWDAWNIDPNYEKHPLPAPQLKLITWIENGPIRQQIQVVKKIGESEFKQDYILDVDSPILEIKNLVNWQERHILIKAAFPLNLEADFATYEIAAGVIERTTKPKTPEEKAKWEVPALRWGDLTQETPEKYGVSLLNNCKYGYDAKPDQLRLSLLRGSTWPDPKADLGIHEFTYSIYPHTGTWKEAKTVQRGYELNMPLLVGEISANQNNQKLPSRGSFLDLGAENLILMAFKQAEDSAEWILRFYECDGEVAPLELKSDLGLRIDGPVDILERNVDNSEPLKIKPWKIAGFRVLAD